MSSQENLEITLLISDSDFSIWLYASCVQTLIPFLVPYFKQTANVTHVAFSATHALFHAT